MRLTFPLTGVWRAEPFAGGRWRECRKPLLLNTLFTNSAIPLGLALPVQDRPLDFFPRLREVRPRDQP